MRRRLAGLSIDAPKAGCKKRAIRMRRRLPGLITDAPKAARSDHGCAEGWMRKGGGADAPKAGVVAGVQVGSQILFDFLAKARFFLRFLSKSPVFLCFS